MTVQILLTIYCLVIVLASATGGHLPSLIRLTHLRTQLLISFVGGMMLGIALIHLLPHASVLLGNASTAGVACLLGIVAMFLLLRAFNPPHAHGFFEASTRDVIRSDDECHHPHGEGGDANVGEGDEHQHEHHHNHDLDIGQERHRRRGVGWIGILIGLWIHTMIDGVALAASTLAESQHPGIVLAGLGTFLAIAFHKPLDAFAITSTMGSGGWSPTHQAIINVVFAVACPVGALLFYFGVTQIQDRSLLLGWGLAISAGFFICISLADLLPEVSFHQHDRGKLTVSLLLGIALAVAVENLPGHSHVHSRPSVGSATSNQDTVSVGEVNPTTSFPLPR